MQPPVEPSVSKTAFSCPHCGAYTTQYWYNLWAAPVTGKNPCPTLLDNKFRRALVANDELRAEVKRTLLDRLARHEAGLVLIEERTDNVLRAEAANLHLSECHHCQKIAVWVRDRLIFPESKATILPNQDLPEEIIHDFEEARSIVNSSPRGAAALLRLCIQKLCTHLLGPQSKDINNDIGTLVKRGLDPTVQKALDIVRVIGNESVHPGTMDLKDDRDTALSLFHLVNSITDQLISHPKKVQSIYAALPQNKLDGIQTRDEKSGGTR